MPKPNACIMTDLDPKSLPAGITRPLEIEGLVTLYYPYIRRLALSILDDGSDNGAAEADDAAQETFIAACRALHTFRGESHLRTWLTSIAVNTCRARLRKRKARQALHTTLAALHWLSAKPAAPEDAALQSESDTSLWRAVDGLGEKHRLPVILRYVHELTVPEIAASLGISEGTVHSRLHVARMRLQARLGDIPARKEASDDSDA